MMEDYLKLKISAPGKVILHGEHSVVYGKPALVAAISARINLYLTENNLSNIELNFKNLQKFCKIPLDDINTILEKLTTQQNSEDDYEFCLTAVMQYIENNTSLFFELDDNEQYKKAITAVLFLLIGILYENGHQFIKNGFHIELSSELELGAGLGSSASFAVSFAAAFLSLAKREEVKNLNGDIKEKISKWAFNSEKIMHGKPSGVDNTICTYGGLLKFRKGESFTSIDFKSNLHILLVNSKIPRSTLKMVEKLMEIHKTFPNITDNIFNAMEMIVEEGCLLYKNILLNDQISFDKIKKLFQINNDLLRALGVSHKSLDMITSIASNYGFSSKLTGAGGGGYMIVLLPNDYKDSKNFHDFCIDLMNEGFEYKEVEIGTKGITIEFL